MIMSALSAELNTIRARQGFTVHITSQDATVLLDGAKRMLYLCATGVTNGLAATLLIVAHG